MKPGPKPYQTDRQQADEVLGAAAQALVNPTGVTPTKVVQKKRYTHEETMALITRAQQGDVGARNAVIVANQGLVGLALKKWRKGVDPDTLEEMQSQATFGLIKAIEKFRVDSGYQFATYAFHWLRAHVGRARDKELRALRSGGSGPTLVSMETKVYGVDDETTLSDVLTDDAPSALDTVLDKERDARVQKALDDSFNSRHTGVWRKPERVQSVLGQRVMNDSPVPLSEVGRQWGLCRERVRQCEAQVLQDLRGSMEGI